MRVRASSRSSPVCASIGWIGLSTVEPEPGQPVRALADRGRRHRPELAREHHRPPDLGDGEARGPRDRLHHHALERALAQLAEEEPDEEPLLGLGRAPEQRRELLAARSLRAGPGDARDPRRGRVHLQRARSSRAARAGSGSSRSAAQPTPIVPCGSTPERYATAIGTSSGDACSSAAASRETFASRDDVAATSAEASAISFNSTAPSCRTAQSAQPPRARASMFATSSRSRASSGPPKAATNMCTTTRPLRNEIRSNCRTPSSASSTRLGRRARRPPCGGSPTAPRYGSPCCRTRYSSATQRATASWAFFRKPVRACRASAIHRRRRCGAVVSVTNTGLAASPVAVSADRSGRNRGHRSTGSGDA